MKVSIKKFLRLYANCPPSTVNCKLYTVYHRNPSTVNRIPYTVYCRSCFTLIELLAAMGVLSLIMFVLISFFSSAQKAWTMSNARAETYENARIALDLITRDLQCAYYVQEKIPFWHGAYPDTGTWGDYGVNDILAFVSATSIPRNTYCQSRLCEIKYQKINAATHSSSNDGWLRRSCTGDKTDGNVDNTKWNFYGNISVGRTTAANAFTANSDSSEDFDGKVIPNVVELSFTCYNKDGEDMSSKTYNYDSNGDGGVDGSGPGKSISAATPYPTPFPYSVKVSLTLLDKASWDKWCALDDDPYDTTTALTATAKGAEENDAAWEFRKNAQRTFTKTIFLGERGQKY